LFTVGALCFARGREMNACREGYSHVYNDIDELREQSYHDLLKAATRAPHERLHHHAGFSAVKDGVISRPDYQALLICLYGFYLPFETAIGIEPIRTRWLESDLAWFGIEAGKLSSTRLCADIPHYDWLERKLGALYVVEGSALGGRALCRGLDALLGVSAIEGRRFFAGRGAGTGAAWLGFLAQIVALGSDPITRATLVHGAVETFELFENWLHGWDETQ
jgi:heme oxygenase